MAYKVTEKALKIIKNMPRVGLYNTPEVLKRTTRKEDPMKKSGRGHLAFRPSFEPHGYEAPPNIPTIQTAPIENYYGKWAIRRQYPHLSLLELQRFIDLGRVDTSRPIDLTQLCNTKLFQCQIEQNHFGVNLLEEGCDNFAARINLEVQWTTELVIAAVEKAGGVITLRYYDPQCVAALADPLKFFKKGSPIPRCKTPPQDLIEYYSDPNFRGYLADPEEILLSREKLAQKYGYKLPDLSDDPVKDLLLMRKDPIQIFYGLEPGSVVNLRDRCVLKPKDKEYVKFYQEL